MDEEWRINKWTVVIIAILLLVIGALIYSLGRSDRTTTTPTYVERSPGAGAGQTQPSPRP